MSFCAIPGHGVELFLLQQRTATIILPHGALHLGQVLVDGLRLRWLTLASGPSLGFEIDLPQTTQQHRLVLQRGKSLHLARNLSGLEPLLLFALRESTSGHEARLALFHGTTLL